jgi:hypothetical protein
MNSKQIFKLFSRKQWIIIITCRERSFTPITLSISYTAVIDPFLFPPFAYLFYCIEDWWHIIF